MNIAILQQELDELENTLTLFDTHNFRARKEALDFVRVIDKISTENRKDNSERIHLQEQARTLSERLQTFNTKIAQNLHTRLISDRPAPQELRDWLQLYTDYMPQQRVQPHHGYENLDFLLDEILLPKPHPRVSLTPKYGMVRYEPTPASVILELTERIAFTADDVFYDLGSGLGKVTILVHLLTGARCEGVEYQPDFCAYADQQTRALNLNSVTYQNADARHANYADATVFFFFNPFGGEIFTTVLERLRLEAQQRELRICSYGSSSKPLSELSWLERKPPINEDEYALAIFRSRD